MSESDEEAGDRTYVQSLARGLAVLRVFGAENPTQTLADVARATGLTRATARRFLLTLEHLGYVRSDGRAFSLTPQVLELGFGYLSALGLPEVARPHLEALSRELGESSSASVLDGAEIVYVARVPVRRIMSVSITIGTRFPAWATSMGRVMLAGLPRAERAAVLDRAHPHAFTERTVTDRAALDIELDRVAEQGFALVDGELESGLRSLAVPVRRGGTVVAAINVATGSSSDADTEAARDRMLPALRAAGQAISTDLDRLPHTEP